MKSLISSFVHAFSRYSCSPKTQKQIDKDSARYILMFVPLVGAIIGGCLYVWGEAWPYLCNYAVLPAVVAAVLPSIISGGAHVEGFIKTVDALSANKSRQKKLEILADSHGGYFAILVCVIYFMLLVGVWSEMPIDGILIMALGYVMSRSLFGLSILTLRHTADSKCKIYVPEEKSAQYVQIIVLALVAMACTYVMIILDPSVGFASVIGVLVAFIYYWFMSYKHFGGITEDCASFFVQLCEVVIPLAALFAYKKWW